MAYWAVLGHFVMSCSEIPALTHDLRTLLPHACRSICFVSFMLSNHVPTGPGKEWVAIIEALYVSPEDGRPCFKGRWYWSLSDVEEHCFGRGEKARAPKNGKHELISSDKRDTNPVEVINRKATILSWKNFRDLFKRNRAACEGVYYTDRMFYHKGKISDLDVPMT